jgi:hypothetical protein
MNVGTFTVSLTVTDSMGLPDPTPQMLAVTVEEPGPIPDPNIAHWRLDDESGPTAVDNTGNGNDGTLAGPLWQVDTPDASPSALFFDGFDDRMDAPAIDVAGQAMSIALWFKVEGYPTAFRDGRLLSKATGLGEQSHYWMLSTAPDGSDTRLRLRIKAGGTTTTLIAPTSEVVIGQWSHVVAVYDGSDMLLYQDGLAVGSTAKSGLLDEGPTVGVTLGEQTTGAGSAPFHGAIDEVGIFARALDSSEVAALYLGAGPPAGVPALGHPARWLFAILLLLVGRGLATRMIRPN